MIPVEIACGVIVVFKEKDENLFLILQHNNKDGSWSFPKGHMEKDENTLETALRELREESGIMRIDILDIPIINEEYEVIRKGITHLKINKYFVGYVLNKNVDIDKSEIVNYKWVTYKEAVDTFLSFQNTRAEVLQKVKKYLS